MQQFKLWYYRKSQLHVPGPKQPDSDNVQRDSTEAIWILEICSSLLSCRDLCSLSRTTSISGDQVALPSQTNYVQMLSGWDISYCSNNSDTSLLLAWLSSRDRRRGAIMRPVEPADVVAGKNSSRGFNAPQWLQRYIGKTDVEMRYEATMFQPFVRVQCAASRAVHNIL